MALSVSIVITNYNYIRFLRHSVQSALTQGADEVIVVDDGSTDGSREVIASFGAAVKPIFKENGGYVSAINLGFLATTGDVILFLDADDRLMPWCVSSMKAAWRPGVSKVQWGQHGIDVEGRRLGILYPRFTTRHTPDWCRREMARQCWYDAPPMSGNAWSRAFLERIMPLPSIGSRRWAPEDYMHLLAPAFGDVISLTEPNSNYRIHHGQLSSHGEFDAEQLANITADEVLRYEAVNRTLSTYGKPLLDPLKWPQHTLNRIFVRRLGLSPKRIAPLLPQHLMAVARSDTGLASKAKSSVLGLALAVSSRRLVERLARMTYQH